MRLRDWIEYWHNDRIIGYADLNGFEQPCATWCTFTFLGVMVGVNCLHLADWRHYGFYHLGVHHGNGKKNTRIRSILWMIFLETKKTKQDYLVVHPTFIV